MMKGKAIDRFLEESINRQMKNYTARRFAMDGWDRVGKTCVNCGESVDKRNKTGLCIVCWKER